MKWTVVLAIYWLIGVAVLVWDWKEDEEAYLGTLFWLVVLFWIIWPIALVGILARRRKSGGR